MSSEPQEPKRKKRPPFPEVLFFIGLGLTIIGACALGLPVMVVAGVWMHRLNRKKKLEQGPEPEPPPPGAPKEAVRAYVIAKARWRRGPMIAEMRDVAKPASEFLVGPSGPANAQGPTDLAETMSTPEDTSVAESENAGPVFERALPGLAIPAWLRFDLSMIALVAANLIPLFGVLFFQWDVATILVLYWTENVVVGFYNMLKMAFLPVSNPRLYLMKFVFIPFFWTHYGGFCFGHALALICIFKLGDLDAIMKGGGTMLIPTLLKPLGVWLVLGLFISHGVSFVQNFLRGPERRSRSLMQLMAEPYRRIVVLQLVIIIGGGLAIALDSPKALVCALVGLKIVVDLFLYVKTHRKDAKLSKDGTIQEVVG